MKKQILKNFLLIAISAIMFSACANQTEEEYSEPLSDKVYEINLSDSLDWVIFNEGAYAYFYSFNLSSFFPNGLPKKGDKIVIDIAATYSEDINYLYSNIFNYNESNGSTTVADSTNILVEQNIKKGVEKHTRKTYTLAKTPEDSLYFEVFYEKSDCGNLLYVGKSTGLGETNPADCDSIWNFRNITNHTIEVYTCLWRNGKVLEVSPIKKLPANSSSNFYFDINALEQKYGNLDDENTYFYKGISHCPFTHTLNDLNTLNWNRWSYSECWINVNELKNKKRITYEYSEIINQGNGNYICQPSQFIYNKCYDLNESDKVLKSSIEDIGIRFAYNPYGPNYQTTINAFNDLQINTGDKIKVTISGITDQRISKLYGSIADVSEEADYWDLLTDDDLVFMENITEDTNFTNEYTFEIKKNPITTDLSKINFVLRYEIEDLPVEAIFRNCNIKIEKL